MPARGPIRTTLSPAAPSNLPTPPSLPPRRLAGMLYSATSEVKAGCRGPF